MLKLYNRFNQDLQSAWYASYHIWDSKSATVQLKYLIYPGSEAETPTRYVELKGPTILELDRGHKDGI